MKLLLYSGRIPPSSKESLLRLIPKHPRKLLILPSDSAHPRSDSYTEEYKNQFYNLGVEQVDI